MRRTRVVHKLSHKLHSNSSTSSRLSKGTAVTSSRLRNSRTVDTISNTTNSSHTAGALVSYNLLPSGTMTREASL